MTKYTTTVTVYSCRHIGYLRVDNNTIHTEAFTGRSWAESASIAAMAFDSNFGPVTHPKRIACPNLFLKMMQAYKGKRTYFVVNYPHHYVELETVGTSHERF